MSDADLDGFVLRLKRRQLTGTFSIALETFRMMRLAVGQCQSGDVIAHMRAVGKKLSLAVPNEIVLGSAVRRAIQVAREECGIGRPASGTAAAAVPPALFSSTSTPDLAALHLSQMQAQSERVTHHAMRHLATSASPLNALHMLHRTASASSAVGGGADTAPTDLSAMLASDAVLATALNDSAYGANSPTHLSTSVRPFGLPTTASALSVSQMASDAAVAAASPTTSVPLHKLKESVAAALREYCDEMEKTIQNISDSALQHIHAHEVILTAGNSLTVLDFFKKAQRKRKFTVIVAELPPEQLSHGMARELSERSLDVTLIPDVSVYAVMSRVNKVVISCHAVLANGGMIAAAGMATIAMAARQHFVPVVVLAPSFKLSPLFPQDQFNESFNVMQSPGSVLQYGMTRLPADVSVLAPAFDYVSPELISYFIMDQGTYPPSHINRLVAEMYNQADYSLDDDIEGSSNHVFAQ